MDFWTDKEVDFPDKIQRDEGSQEKHSFGYLSPNLTNSHNQKSVDVVKPVHYHAAMTTAHGENDWKIRINGGEEHPVPHAHIIFRDGQRVSVALDSLEILAGSVRPQKRMTPAVVWILAHRDELIAEYRRLN